MKIWKLTHTHNSYGVLAKSTYRYQETATAKAITEKIFIDHHWPINYWEHRKRILELAESSGHRVMAPYKNLGGHGGYNWAINNLPIADEDFIVTFDSDSNPVTPGWDSAMLEAFEKNPKVAAVHLMHEHIVNGRTWFPISSEGPQLVVPNAVDMYNVTMWRASFLKQVGLKGTGYYGSVEVGMLSTKKELGVEFAYLWDFRETVGKVPIDETYQEWKQAVLAGDSRNFDEYYQAMGSFVETT